MSQDARQVSRIVAWSEKHGALLHLDVNSEIYPMQEKEKFLMVLSPTLNYSGAPITDQAQLQCQMKIAELKQICARPDVVEAWDATAADPKLLVFLKSYRNTVLILYLEATTVRMLHRNYPL